MEKEYLFTPGPTMVPPQVLTELGQPMIHHRAPEFDPIFEEVSQNLKYVFQTEQEVLTIVSSGTGAMEASVSNLLSEGDKAIAIVGGKFGERWAELCKAYKVDVIEIPVEWGESYPASSLKKVLEENPDVKAVYATLCETCTGALYDIKGYAQVIKDTPAVLVVDAISGLGADVLKMDEWEVDVVVSCSQKAFMCPPGLSFIALSDKAWKLTESSTLPKYYLNLTSYLKSQKKLQTPYTSGVALIRGLNAALKMIKEEGLENVWKRHERMSRALLAAVEAMGLEPFSKNRANTLVSVKAPEGISAGKIKSLIREKYGFTIAGGQAQLKGKIFRIAALGYACDTDVIMIIGALEMVLNELGYEVELGKGVKAALNILGG